MNMNNGVDPIPICIVSYVNKKELSATENVSRANFLCRTLQHSLFLDNIFVLFNWPVSLEVECQTWVQKVWGSHPGQVLAETINLSIFLLLCETLHNKR